MLFRRWLSSFGLSHTHFLTNHSSTALGASDPAQFARAIHERRVLVTYNVRDFVILAGAAATAARDHCGLVLINDRHLPPSDLGGLIKALATLLTTHADPDALRNQIVFLRRAAT